MFKKLIVVAMVVMLFFAIKAGTANADLVTNGSFTTGDFTGWTISGNTDSATGAWYFVNNDGLSLIPAAPSATYAQFGSTTFLTSITQNIATTPGQGYAVTFWLANDAPASMGFNEFLAEWNGVIQNPSMENADAFGWTEYGFWTRATSSSTPITFAFQQDASVFDFTGVTAAAAPVPLPAVSWLFASGLIGLAGLRKRKKTSQQ